MSSVSIDLPSLHRTQREVRNVRSRFKIVRCGRRFGKTTLAAVMCIEVAAGIAWWHHRCHPDADGAPTPGVAWWVPPTYKIAAIGWRVIEAIARTLIAAGVQIDVRRSSMEVVFPGGGMIVVRSADSPSGLRGSGIDFLVMEEAAYCPEDAWTEALRPALADRRGEAMFITTPSGYNWFWELENRSLTLPDWQVFHAPTSANPNIDPAEIDDMRAEMGPMEFQQEVLAEYVDDASQPFKRAWIRHGTLLPSGDMRLGDEVTTLADCVVYADVDLAASLKETADYTVIATCALTPAGNLLVVDVVRERLPAPDLIPTLRRLHERYDWRWVGIERVGYQLAAVQLARRDGLPVRELKADRDKYARSIPLQVRMEAGTVFFPDDALWLREVETELLTFPSGEHDDIVDALSYAAIDAGRVPSYVAY